MKAVACLIRMYFTGTSLLRWFSVLGLALILFSVVAWFAISSRTTAGLIRSLVVLIAIRILPPASIRMNPDASLVGPLIATVISWVVLGAYALFAHRLRNAIPTKVSISPPVADGDCFRLSFPCSSALDRARLDVVPT